MGTGVEASPDTDNLIALAALYGVSLDELVLGKKPESSNKTAPGTITVEKGNKTVVIDGGSSDGHLFGSHEKGIHIHVDDDDDDYEDDAPKSEYVFGRGEKGIHISVNSEDDGDGPACSPVHRFFRAFPFWLLTVIAYLIFGLLHICGGWAYSWLVFFLIPIYYSLVESVFRRKADSFAFPVLVTMIYLWFGFQYSLWHPMWVLFLIIPFYYFICEFIRKVRKKK